ncbi:DNA-3-methyladenine glycosylase 2 family protein [Kangiella sediminilitoris]|uniref:DNA-3-methyladenine glycosylase II n=1 Tax=Kangiella sediminilitoris TaxID=1144748 RepID=A0A1B3BC14_9GAMM|nr:AlkA N-terminal domain-containing protein [Kangiella sediminilitoris]AOE50342.1 Transcriptional regulator, AraC family [Kangiella sediminilitoris]
MKSFQKARLARDARYDGKFFIAVKTTNIYCRPICPASPPKEENVEYFLSAAQAQEAGFRPCLRCRPESAPLSSAWLGNQAVLNKAMQRIQSGALNNHNLESFSESLGISSRYLRKLFQQHLGMSPQSFANHQRLMLAKQLLHQTQMPITDIALSSGFNSVRRFNDSFKQTMKLTPSELRRKAPSDSNTQSIQLTLSYQPPYNWTQMQQFLEQRELPLIEKVSSDCYSRTFSLKETQGWFRAVHVAQKNCFKVDIHIENTAYLMPAIAQIKKVLDIDSDVATIEKQLAKDKQLKSILTKGLRLPACWNTFEAGIKAILGQQVSVKAAYGHTHKLIEQLGSETSNGMKYFPTPSQVAKADLSFLKMPGRRKQTLTDFAQWFCEQENSNREFDLQEILDIKGIGPWSYEYIKLRSGLDPDAFPEKDLGVIKALEKYQMTDTSKWSPWRSYATLHLWNSL